MTSTFATRPNAGSSRRGHNGVSTRGRTVNSLRYEGVSLTSPSTPQNNAPDPAEPGASPADPQAPPADPQGPPADPGRSTGRRVWNWFRGLSEGSKIAVLLAVLGGLFTFGAAFVPVIWGGDDNQQEGKPVAGASTPEQPRPTPSSSPSGSTAPSQPADEPEPSGPSPTKKAPQPGTVLRTETFALASGYGFNLEDKPLRPAPGATSQNYDIWHSDAQEVFGTSHGATFVLMPEETRRVTYETCSQQSAYEIWLDMWDMATGRSICMYGTNGVVGLMEVVRSDDKAPEIKVTLWQGTA